MKRWLALLPLFFVLGCYDTTYDATENILYRTNRLTGEVCGFSLLEQRVIALHEERDGSGSGTVIAQCVVAPV